MDQTFQNPVYGHCFPDPFVLKFQGVYWAYGTGFWHDGRCIGILRSTDLVHWTEHAGAMNPLPGAYSEYWAPEVTYLDGTFYLYYSVGDGVTMQLRVATSGDPGGPFIDTGVRLTDVDFAIDPHVFVDDDGRRYLFYATDFLEHSHIGTGTVVDRLMDPFTLEGRPKPVTRAMYDWQVFDPQRASKGGVRWHTVEGSFVLKRKGIYYHMFSGGNWQNPTYGVGYAVSNRIDAPGEWQQVVDGKSVLPLLRTIPGKVIGPGHNSVVRGPDNRQLFCVYHSWVGDERVMAIDRLEWVGDRLTVLGPSTGPEPMPIPPTLTGFESSAWRPISGTRQSLSGDKVRTDDGALTCALPSSSALIEVSVCVQDAARGYDILLGPEQLLKAGVDAVERRVYLEWDGDGGRREQRIPLPTGFDAGMVHLLRVEIDGRRVSLVLDSIPVWKGMVSSDAGEITLLAHGPVELSGPAITAGWQDEFAGEDAAFGWSMVQGDAEVRIVDKELAITAGGSAVVAKKPAFEAYELVVNLRPCDTARNGSIGVYPAWTPADPGPLFALQCHTRGWTAALRGAEAEPIEMQMPASFDPGMFRQVRFRKGDGGLTACLDGRNLGRVPASSGPSIPAFYVRDATAVVDMVRITALSSGA